ncbi:MAG: AAA family ATPase [Candidatus Competibacterales bacterium]
MPSNPPAGLNGNFWNRLLAGLECPEAYPHPTTTIECLENHISWVFLTGQHVYKLKKPVDLGFIDFSTPDLRLHYCREELRLNRRWSPHLYLDVVAVVGDVDRPRVVPQADPGGRSPLLAHAVHMKQFARDALWSQRAATGRLRAEQVDRLAELVGAFHQGAPRSPLEEPWGNGDQRRRWIGGTVDRLVEVLADGAPAPQARQLRDGLNTALASHAPRLEARRRAGWVREGHGDLHLNNIALVEGQVSPFDCIEFEPALRWMDVMGEVAFPIMDLLSYHQRPWAFRLLDRYLSITGDYGGLAVLPLFIGYRAAVRALATGLALAQHPERPADPEQHRRLERYLQQAQDALAWPTRPWLLLTCGLSGSGKTTVAGQLLEQLGAVRIRSDVERKRIHGLTPGQRGGDELYTPEADGKTYARLLQAVGEALEAGFAVIADAAFGSKAQRQPFLDLAAARGIPGAVLHCTASEDLRRGRVTGRRAWTNDASDAHLDMLNAQAQAFEAPREDEGAPVIPVDTGQTVDISSLTATVERTLMGRVSQ